jgi:hypothetical protein
MSLADRIRAAREQWVNAGGREWLLRRPTVLQLGRMAREPTAIVFSSVVGWKIPEHELVPGGGGAVPAFEPEAFREWAEDHPEVLREISGKLNEIIAAHADKEQAAEKN